MRSDSDSYPVLDRRRAGILLHLTSLPGGYGNGDLGPHAYRFVDFAAACGFSVWQTLPLGPTDGGLSPYSCQSIYAGNPRLISLELLVQQGWLEPDSGVVSRDPAAYRRARLRQARAGFLHSASAAHREEYRSFTAQQAYWLNNHAMFQAIKEAQGGGAWWEWPKPLRHRDPDALQEARVSLADSIEQHRFEQFLFFQQWLALKRYANQQGILLFGDMPIFVAEDSVTVWARWHYFRLNAEGRPQVVAGVPPDYFSATGQRWGNPHYDWEQMQRDNFKWWRERLRNQLLLFDLIRIDHFRGFEAIWEIDGREETAVNGRWVKVPGKELFQALQQEFRTLPVVAEDLGIITPEVNSLRDYFGFPGMRVLHFAFDDSPDNPYLPHNHVANCVVYAGTHDNNTTLGWFSELTPKNRAYVCEYLGISNPETMPWPVVRSLYASVAKLAVVTMQDILGLEAKHRMNVPGVAQGNWQWRFSWDQIAVGTEAKLRHLARLYGREIKGAPAP
jgi:4-alpha-glucanotransferase